MDKENAPLASVRPHSYLLLTCSARPLKEVSPFAGWRSVDGWRGVDQTCTTHDEEEEQEGHPKVVLVAVHCFEQLHFQ